MELRFLGGVGQVGRSAILVSDGGSNILLDYGVKTSKPPLFPLHVAPRDLSALIVSHAHLDHSGGTPYLYISGTMNAYMTPPTIDIIDLLIKDFLKLSGPSLPFEYLDLRSLESKTIPIEYHQKVDISGTPFTIELLNAGHIPGSSQVLVDLDSKRLLYTSDINGTETRLQPSAESDYGEIDVMICESTYAGTTHPAREEQEEKFVEKVEEVVEDGGVALIPAFAIGRSQEILMILTKHGFDGNIYMDGMAITATRIFMNHRDFLKNPQDLERALDRVNKVNNWKQRKRIINDPCAIIAPAGMLGGGSAVYYMSKVYDDVKNAIFVVGFQVPGTPGSTLIEEKKTYIRGRRLKVRAEVHNNVFSSHIDQRGFEDLFKNVEGEPTVFLVHGEPDKIKVLERFVSEEVGLEAKIPGLGDKFEIDNHSVV